MDKRLSLDSPTKGQRCGITFPLRYDKIFFIRYPSDSWWRHQMETFSALLTLCEGKPPVTDEFPSRRPVTQNFDVFFVLRLKKRLSKQSRHRWVPTPSPIVIFFVLANCSSRCYTAHWSNICTSWHSVPQLAMEYNNYENSYRFKHYMCGKLTMVPPASWVTWTCYRQSVVYEC